MTIANIKQRYFLLFPLSFRSPQIFYKEETGMCLFPVSQPPYVSLTSAFTVLEEEVKRSEMWKLTCQECKINTISAGIRKQNKTKSNNEKRTDLTKALFLP